MMLRVLFVLTGSFADIFLSVFGSFVALAFELVDLLLDTIPVSHFGKFKQFIA